jgi:hypothetical protein
MEPVDKTLRSLETSRSTARTTTISPLNCIKPPRTK